MRSTTHHSKRSRPIFGASAMAVTVITCIFIARISSASVISTAAIIFFFSLLGFHITAIFTFRYARIWKATDYFLELSTIISVFAALAGIQEGAQNDFYQSEFTRRKGEQEDLLYAI